ncbi:MAG: iron-containing alcohol dehydrogenase, partial [Oscillospiraceae bacterium]
MNKIYCRAYQAVFRLAANFMNWSVPVVYQGENAIKDIGKIILENNLAPIMLVTDKGITATDIYPKIIDVLEKANISYTVFSETVVNPTITNVETALTQYQKNGCQGILAIGGGSPLDCAKGLAARIARPKKSLSKMRGELKVGKKTPVLIAVPTTAGTGSETTIAAVITDPDTHEKYAINDMVLIPKYAVLDPLLTIGLPPHITSTTGVDALTHAVEAYVGHS